MALLMYEAAFLLMVAQLLPGTFPIAKVGRG